MILEMTTWILLLLTFISHCKCFLIQRDSLMKFHLIPKKPICFVHHKRNIQYSYHRLHLSTNLSFSHDTESKRIVFLGTPECAASSLQLLHDYSNETSCPFNIVAVVTQPPARAGRNKNIMSSPVHILAEKLNIPVLFPTTARDPEFLDKLIALKPHLCITAAYGNFLPRKFLEIPSCGTVNIHPSLLPKYRGAAPVQRCLESGDEETGVSVVFTVLKMDAGPIISQYTRKLSGNETANDMLDELFTRGTHDLIRSLPNIFDNTIVSMSQDESKATNATKISSTEGVINFATMSSLEIHNKARAFSEWPGIWSSFLLGKTAEPQRIKIITTKVISSQKLEKFELDTNIKILKEGKDDILHVTCFDGSILGILDVQPEGKKIMPVKALINGLKNDKVISWVSPKVS